METSVVLPREHTATANTTHRSPVEQDCRFKQPLSHREVHTVQMPPSTSPPFCDCALALRLRLQGCMSPHPLCSHVHGPSADTYRALFILCIPQISPNTRSLADRITSSQLWERVLGLSFSVREPGRIGVDQNHKTKQYPPNTFPWL